VGPPRMRSPGPPEQKRRIRSMFDSVAPRYDLLNHLLSAGIDRRWRARAVRALELEPGHVLVDLCTGTGDLGFAAAKAGAEVVGVDLSRGMLVRGAAKTSDGSAALRFVQGDAERLPLAAASVDRAAVGFGIRNCSRLEVALAESARVLKPGGRLVILEFTTPPGRLWRSLYHGYFHAVLPRIGGWVSGHPEAYAYLPDSVSGFPDPERLSALMENAGFSRVTFTRLTGGVACLHVGDR